MEKPTVFFSHCSHDKKYISELNKIISDKTSGMINIFQSSDGQSIPFGRNWVHSIEESLQSSKIMFVFISPISIESNWIYFESGYSYCKGIKVIPIGILGLDIGKINPPLSLLQGFNISSFEGLNNILAVLNTEFDSKFQTDFNESDFYKLSQYSQSSHLACELADNIDYIESDFSSDLSENKFKENILNIILHYLDTNQIDYIKVSDKEIKLYGINIKLLVNSDKTSRIVFTFDILKLSSALNIMKELLPLVYENQIDKWWFKIHFNENVDLVTTDYKVSAKLQDLGIEMLKDKVNLYKYGLLFFSLNENKLISTIGSMKVSTIKYLRIVYSLDSYKTSEVYELLNLLNQGNLVYFNQILA